MAKKVALFGVSDKASPQSRVVNTGNIMHAAAGRKIVGDFEEVSATAPWGDELVERLNSEFSHIVCIAANGIRVGAKDSDVAGGHDVTRRNIERTQIPVVVFGLGAQLPPVHDELVIPQSTRALMKCLGERNGEIAVRGATTAEVLNDIGVKNAFVAGCPSNFWWLKPRFEVEMKPVRPRTKAQVGFSYTGPIRERALIHQAVKRGFTIIGQEHRWERDLIDGVAKEKTELPFWRMFETEEQWQAWRQAILERFRMYYSLEDWMAALEDMRFVYGTRFHGNMTALQSGVRSLWISHDSRTRELCEYHALPHMPLEEAIKGRKIPELVAASETDAYVARYPECYSRFHGYLERSGLPHRLPSPDGKEPSREAPAKQPRTTNRTVAYNRAEMLKANAGRGVEVVAQTETNTGVDRYPAVFAAAAAAAGNEGRRVLSFGCSSGEEAETLAGRYFTRPEDRIAGVDVNEEMLALARKHNPDPRRISYTDAASFAASGETFDVVFAMSVLCAWPISKDRDEISDLFPFARFETMLGEIDRRVAPGGLLVVVNANYRVEDTAVGAKYAPMTVEGVVDRGFVKRFDRESRALAPDDAPPYVLFRKPAAP